MSIIMEVNDHLDNSDVKVVDNDFWIHIDPDYRQKNLKTLWKTLEKKLKL